MKEHLDWIDEKVLIPDLLKAAPQVRPVLDRYGLRGCGGEFGPMETLEFFAKAHEVPLQPLLSEIRVAWGQNSLGPAKDAAREEALADTIYQPFFQAGIITILSLGAVWGAYLLLKIGFGGSFTAVNIHEVNAHGHAQIFGWVGLFVMGFAYQAFPRFKHTVLQFPRLAHATLWLMAAGILLRGIGEPLAVAHPWVIPSTLLGAVLEIVAIGMFIAVIFLTLKQSGKEWAFYDRYILASLGWFFVQAVYEAILLRELLAAHTPERLLYLVSTWQTPMREIQIHGFALLMILGVSQRVFHNFYGLPAPDQVKSRRAFWLLNGAILGEICGFLLMRHLGHAWAFLWYGAVLLLAGTVVWLASGWRIFSTAGETDRSLKFLRTAYLWLFISLGMMVAIPVYQFGLLGLFAPGSNAAVTGFSHAYYGAVRHAVTVGFISLMIVGVAAKVVPTLKGVDVRRLTPLWAPFVLINAGCFMRVFFQVLTDFTPTVFPVAGVSGLLEVTGLAIWGLHLFQVMAGRAKERQGVAVEGATPLEPGAAIVGTNIVGDILLAFPTTLETLVALGFTPLKNPLLRAAFAPHLTLESACRKAGVSLEEALFRLNSERVFVQKYGALEIGKVYPLETCPNSGK